MFDITKLEFNSNHSFAIYKDGDLWRCYAVELSDMSDGRKHIQFEEIGHLLIDIDARTWLHQGGVPLLNDYAN